MTKIRIVTDAAADIENPEKYGIQVIPFQIHYGEGKSASTAELSKEDFYRIMDSEREIPTTSQASPLVFEQIYTEMDADGTQDLIVVLLNGQGSGTYNNAFVTAQNYKEEHPESVMRIHCIDSGGYTAMLGTPVVKAAKMIADHKSADEIVRYLRHILPRRRIYCGLYSLDAPIKSGRVSNIAGIAGEKLNLKPVVTAYQGKITVIRTTLGEKLMLSKVAKYAVRDMIPNDEYEILYGSDTAARDRLIKLMKELTGYDPAAVHQIGPVIAAHAGHRIAAVVINQKDK